MASAMGGSDEESDEAEADPLSLHPNTGASSTLSINNIPEAEGEMYRMIDKMYGRAYAKSNN
jgi:hypothetical protein